jgi:hypothetical protein
MTAKNPFVDDAGEEVLRFISAARNLSRLGELTNEVVEIAKSGAWRRYKTAIGVDEWRECELDYFLIACDLHYDDVARIVTYTREGLALAPLMDHDADGQARRSLEDASAGWNAPVPETLLDRARRLGWTRGEASPVLRVPPVPDRARARHAHGVTMDEHARQTREERLPRARREELRRVAERVIEQTTDELELRYVLDALRTRVAGAGRPQRSETEMKQWADDVARLQGDTSALAEEWGISRRAAQARVRRLTEAGLTGTKNSSP